MESWQRKIEEVGLNAFPALQTELYDGWLLRFSEGYTYRANAVYPLYEGTESLEEKVRGCEIRYLQRKLPCAFRVTDTAPAGLDTLLAARGYRLVKTVVLMTKRLRDFYPRQISPHEIEISYKMTARWFSDFLQFTPMAEEKSVCVGKTLLERIGGQVFSLRAKVGMRCVGTCLAVLERGFLGIFALHVDKNFQRQGIGGKLCLAALSAGKKRRAECAYLQARSENLPAVRLYEKLGFASGYTYWFREKELPRCRKIAD